jgi:CheY-like chemotaxis protein
MEADIRSIKLLLVDDDDEFRDAASTALTRQGLQVTEAESGERALEILATFRPDIIVLDLKMAGMDGITALGKLREIDRDLPVIILTGHGRYEDALAGIQLGVVDFVQKPVDLKRLGARIREMVAAGPRLPMKEKTIAQLMVPESLYLRIYADQTVREAVSTLQISQRRQMPEGDPDRGRRVLLVFDRDGRFVGLLRAHDIVQALIPRWLETPYSSFFTGMFLAQAKVVGEIPIKEFIRTPTSIDVEQPLMEAAYLLASRRLSHLAVMSEGQLIGMLRPEDLYKEIATPFG